MKLTNKLSREIKKQLDSSIFVGRLTTMDEIHSNTIYDDSVEMIDTHLTFFIKSLSPMPESITRYFSKSHSFLSGRLSTLQNDRLIDEEIDYRSLPHWELKEKVKGFLENKTIVFKLIHNNGHLNVIILKVEDIPPSQSYIVIPAPDLKTGETREDLRNKLIVDKRPITLRKYPNMFTPPNLIMYDETIYKVELESKSNDTTYFQKDRTSVEYLPLSLDEKIDLIDVVYEHHLYFLSSEKYQKLQTTFKNSSQSLLVTGGMPLVENEPELKPEPTIVTDPVTIPADGLSEKGFLEQLIHRARYEHNMFYRSEDLYSFHMSVKTNPLTVLGGMSGTGKSQLARIYGESLGLVERKTMLFLPISPSYQEPNDILGYLNPKSETFHESDTGLVSLLLDAEKNPDQLYMVIFDEMNLSQVEHWFSPFLSLLEINGDKYLQIYNEHNKEKSGYYQAKIKLGDNLIFVGTVNFDETTKSFSDRLLDRTNIITPEKAPFSETIAFYQEINQANPSKLKTNVISRGDLRERWKQNNSTIGLHLLSEDEIYILDQLHDLMNDIDPQKGVSFRVALAIVDFISNVPVNESGESLIPRKKLFDFQINQRILTKIKGIDTFARPLVGHLLSDNEQYEYQDGKLSKLFKSDRAQLVSDFDISLKTLKNKAKELMMYGFTN
ncbi:hypothetical protein GH741_01350 [Aquibacillus halophilus]|uniref:AAA domain-containing protein n=1 Tax=Aquibacillus halophilus TaxID=930132 RepID=A0A6A8DEI0_9BACI|nr:hypothetical protein [Aquibacillus halophilus]MRH41317.1 hypothetical protein [Aquibacillus halophilus]